MYVAVKDAVLLVLARTADEDADAYYEALQQQRERRGYAD